jgi:5-methylcytosine-specific restriction protein A
MDFFIGSIADDEGKGQLAKALTALRLHIEYRVADDKNPIENRAILAKYEARLAKLEVGNDATPVFLRDLESGFNKQVDEAKNSTKQERQKRLARAARQPRRVAKLVYVFERNPDVVAEVLCRANGICEGCGATAPFTRKSNHTPYLEVHHKVPLAEEGEDTVENAIALCPNCHRQKHFG